MKVKVLSNVIVVADVDRAIYRWRKLEDYAKQAESLVKEFDDFVRDHRSMDWVDLRVVREYEEQCSHCGNLWEVDFHNVPVCCQAASDEYEKKTTHAN
jgi:hypothetical protein